MRTLNNSEIDSVSGRGFANLVAVYSSASLMGAISGGVFAGWYNGMPDLSHTTLGPILGNFIVFVFSVSVGALVGFAVGSTVGLFLIGANWCFETVASKE